MLTPETLSQDSSQTACVILKSKLFFWISVALDAKSTSWKCCRRGGRKGCLDYSPLVSALGQCDLVGEKILLTHLNLSVGHLWDLLLVIWSVISGKGWCSQLSPLFLIVYLLFDAWLPHLDNDSFFNALGKWPLACFQGCASLGDFIFHFWYKGGPSFCQNLSETCLELWMFFKWTITLCAMSWLEDCQLEWSSAPPASLQQYTNTLWRFSLSIF